MDDPDPDFFMVDDREMDEQAIWNDLKMSGDGSARRRSLVKTEAIGSRIFREVW